jgi:hypothetical protein
LRFKEREKLRIMVSITSGPERPDAAKGDQRSPDAMDLDWASASLAFRTNNAGIMGLSLKGRYRRTADVAAIVEVAKIVTPTGAASTGLGGQTYWIMPHGSGARARRADNIA